MAFIRKSVSLKDKEIVQNQARPLPVVVMLDISASMTDTIEGGTKISILNNCVKQMLKTFTDEESLQAEINCQIVTFGGESKVHTTMTPAKQIEFVDMQASGATPMGGALTIVKNLIENKELISSRSYRPTVILVSDGYPNDNWENHLEDFKTGRSGKADRMALFIGKNSGKDVLYKFLGDEHSEKFFTANRASEIVNFFKFVTMSVSTKSKSSNPNEIPSVGSIKQQIEEDDDEWL